MPRSGTDTSGVDELRRRVDWLTARVDGSESSGETADAGGGGGGGGGGIDADGVLAQGGGSDGNSNTVEASLPNLTDVGDTPSDDHVVRYDAGTSMHKYVEYVLGALTNVATANRADQDVLKWDGDNTQYKHTSLSDLIGDSVEIADIGDILVGGTLVVRDDLPPTDSSFTEQDLINKYDAAVDEDITELKDNSIWIETKTPPPSQLWIYDKDNDQWSQRDGGFLDGGLLVGDTVEVSKVKTDTLDAETGFFNEVAVGGMTTVRQDTKPTASDYADKYSGDFSDGIPDKALWIDTAQSPPQPKKYDKSSDTFSEISVAIFDGQIIADESIETQKLSAESIEADKGLFNNLAIGNFLQVRQPKKPDKDDFAAEHEGDFSDGIPNNALWIDSDADPTEIYRYVKDNEGTEQDVWQKLDGAFLDGGLLTADTIEAQQIDAGSITTDLLDAEAITTDKLAAGAITANTISANVTYSDKFASIGGENLIVNPSLTNGEGDITSAGWEGVTALDASNTNVDEGAPTSAIGQIDDQSGDLPSDLARSRYKRDLQYERGYFLQLQVTNDNADYDLEVGYLTIDDQGGKNFSVLETVSKSDDQWSLLTFEFGPLQELLVEEIALGFNVNSNDTGTWYFATPELKSMVDSTVIEGGSITTDEIDANTITAENIAANTITADQIKAGAITAEQIKAGTVTSEKFVSVTSTLTRNGNFRNATDNGSEPSSAEWTNVTALSDEASDFDSLPNPNTGFAGRLDGVARNPNGWVGSYNQNSEMVVTGEVLSDGAGNDLVMDVVYLNDDGTEEFVQEGVISPTGGSWTPFNRGVDVPTHSNARPLKLIFRPDGTDTEKWYLEDVSFRQRANQTVIEGGSITTNELTADAVTADEIAADSVQAEQIQADAITSDEIASNTILGDNISATASIEVGENTPRILLDGDNTRIESTNFSSGVEGFRIGLAQSEFKDIKARGEFEVTTFVKESVNAVGGGLAVAESTTLAATAQSGDTTLYVRAQVFEAGDDVRLKDANADDVRTVSSVNNSPSTGDQAITLGSGVSQEWGQGTAILRWNAERIFLDASNDGNTPFQSVVNSSNTETVRLGNLDGKSGITGSGIYAERGLFTEDVVIGGRSLTPDSFGTPVIDHFGFDETVVGARGTEPIGLASAERIGDVITNGDNLNAQFVSAKFGKGVNLDQASNVTDQPKDGVLEYDVTLESETWGISFWTDLSVQTQSATVFHYRTDANNRLTFLVDVYNQTVYVTLVDAGVSETFAFTWNGDLSEGHFTLTRDEDTFELWLDNTSLGTHTSTKSLPTDSTLELVDNRLEWLDSLVLWEETPIESEINLLVGSEVPLVEVPDQVHITGDRVSAGRIRSVAETSNNNPVTEINLNTGAFSFAGGLLVHLPDPERLEYNGRIDVDSGEIAAFDITGQSISSGEMLLSAANDLIRFSDSGVTGTTQFSDAAFVDHEFDSDTDPMKDSWNETVDYEGKEGNIIYYDSNGNQVDSTADWHWVMADTPHLFGGEYSTTKVTVTGKSSRDLSARENDEATVRAKLGGSVFSDSNGSAGRSIKIKVIDDNDGSTIFSQKKEIGEAPNNNDIAFTDFNFEFPSDASAIKFEFVLTASAGVSYGGTAGATISIRTLDIYQGFPQTVLQKDQLAMENDSGKRIVLDRGNAVVQSKTGFGGSPAYQFGDSGYGFYLDNGDVHVSDSSGKRKV